MLSSLLTSAYYANQLSSVSISQNIQQIAVDAFFRNYGGTQAAQVTNAQAFIQINASVSVQHSQSLTANAIYYDIGASGALTQSTQSVSANGYVQINAQVNAVQANQYVYIASTNGVFTAQSASRVYDRAWILRRVRNKGAR